jgi:hypothetical protein
MIPSVAVISFSTIHSDARVLRQVAYLSKHFAVTVIGYGHLGSPHNSDVQMRSIQRPGGVGPLRKARTLVLLPLGRLLPEWSYESWYWNRGDRQTALSALFESDAQVILANNWDALPIAARVSEKTGASIVVDLHEYTPLQHENWIHRRVFFSPMVDYFLRKYSPCVSASVTVGETIGEKYAQEYGIRPVVVMNAPRRMQALKFEPTDPEHIRLIHHGAAVRDRKLESMIETLAHTDSRYTLHFMLIESDKRYASRLKAMAGRLAPGRVFFHPPVKPVEIVRRISEFDVGFYLLPFASFNQEAALPNKFFDFVAAGLAVCVGPSPEMARLARQYGFGVVAPSFEPAEVAKTLDRLTAADIDQMKLRSLQAKDTLNADVEMARFVSLCSRFI